VEGRRGAARVSESRFTPVSTSDWTAAHAAQPERPNRDRRNATPPVFQAQLDGRARGIAASPFLGLDAAFQSHWWFSATCADCLGRFKCL